MKAIVEYYYKAQDFPGLNETISVLSKKHGQLKNVIQELVELVIAWLPDVKTKNGNEKWLELLETLRVVTEGKVSTVFSVLGVYSSSPSRRSSLKHLVLE